MMPTKAPSVLAWTFFPPAVLFITVDIIRLNISGIFLLGVVFLALWAWLLGVFTRDFWVGDIEPETHPGTLSRFDRLDGVGNRKDAA